MMCAISKSKLDCSLAIRVMINALRSLTLVCLLPLMAFADETNLAQSQREFRDKYRLDEQGKIQMQGFAVPDLNASGHNQSSINMKQSDLKAVNEINLTAFERNELNVSKLQRDMNRTNKNAEAVNLFFKSVEAQRKIDEQTRFILKDEAFGAREYAGEYQDIIDDQLNDTNNSVFSASQGSSNNRYLDKNEQVIIVISSSIPKSTLRNYFQDIDAIEAPFDVKFVLRGVIGNAETLMPTMDYIASIASKESALNKDKPIALKDIIGTAIKKGVDSNTIDTYKVQIDINPKVTRKYAIDRVPAVIFVKNYNPAIEQPKTLNEAINANDKEEFYVAYGASKLDYSLSKINEKAKSEGLKRLINALQNQGFFGSNAQTQKTNTTNGANNPNKLQRSE
jgi:translation initiation factor 2 beta subunit (eIF-2beta)/eIF-5